MRAATTVNATGADSSLVKETRSLGSMDERLSHLTPADEAEVLECAGYLVQQRDSAAGR